MTDAQLLLLGPAFTAIGLILFAIPALRPRILTRTIGWFGACMCVPMVVGVLCNSLGLMTLAFMAKPLTAVLSVMLFFAYVVMCRSKEFPLFTALPSLAMLLGAISDFYAVRQLAGGWGGAYC